LAWPEIKAALEAGHSLKTVWERLQADGIEIRYNRLSEYVARLRRCHLVPETAASVHTTATPYVGKNQSASQVTLNDKATGQVPGDPAANLRDRLGGTRGFDFGGTGKKEDLI
jgi:hypothetical protein